MLYDALKYIVITWFGYFILSNKLVTYIGVYRCKNLHSVYKIL